MQRSEDQSPVLLEDRGRTTPADLSKQCNSAEVTTQWRKPSMEAISCGLEINGYMTGRGRR